MLRRPGIRLTLALPALLAVLWPALLAAQGIAQSDVPGDPNDAPLGDVARNLRKKTPASSGVIDDDNLSQVMESGESRRPESSALKFLMAGEGKGFQLSGPDVTCSLAFNVNAKALLSSQYAQMDLPHEKMLKLEGPATIEGDALMVSVFNGTDWHVSEVVVALTVVEKKEPNGASRAYGEAPLVAGSLPLEADVRPEKKPDVTIIYKMRAAAAPFATTVFSAPLNLDLLPGEEWHWAIVQAKGYPPENYSANVPQTTAQSSEPTILQPTGPSSLLAPQDSPAQNPSAVAPPQSPQ